jgi:hypothetical protein
MYLEKLTRLIIGNGESRLQSGELTQISNETSLAQTLLSMAFSTSEFLGLGLTCGLVTHVP